MTKKMDVTEQQLRDAAAAAYGRRPVESKVALFEQAGLCHEDAVRGAAMMESGCYFGFEDVISSLQSYSGATLHDGGLGFRKRNPALTDARVKRVVESIAAADDGDRRERAVEKLIEAAAAGETVYAQSIARDLQEDAR